MSSDVIQSLLVLKPKIKYEDRRANFNSGNFAALEMTFQIGISCEVSK